MLPTESTVVIGTDWRWRLNYMAFNIGEDPFYFTYEFFSI